MSSDCQSEEQAPEPATSDRIPRVKILLHAVDGAFPYLTPQLLQRCFRPQTFPMLQLGVAIQDSCIAPIFIRKNGKVGTKPSGFKVSAMPVDEWLNDYPRVAVPTFDPMAILPGVSAKNHRTALQQQQQHQPATSTITTKSTIKNPKVPHVILQTLNGRVQVTHAEYGQTVAASSFVEILPLLEHPPDDNRPLKHVMERNFDWTVAALTDSSSSSSVEGSPVVWLPVSVAIVPSETAPGHRIDGDRRADLLLEHVDDIRQWMASLDESLYRRLSHVCFVDWHLLHDQGTRQNILDAFDGMLPAKIGMALLTVESVDQLSLALQFAQTTARSVTVGTSIPTKLAQQCQALTLQRGNAVGRIDKKARLDPAVVADGFEKRQDVVTACTVALKATHPVPAHPWFQDAGPIDDECSCMTCRDHSRSYLYHLACSNELLVEILLFVHNLHQILVHSTDQSTT